MCGFILSNYWFLLNDFERFPCLSIIGATGLLIFILIDRGFLTKVLSVVVFNVVGIDFFNSKRLAIVDRFAKDFI